MLAVRNGKPTTVASYDLLYLRVRNTTRRLFYPLRCVWHVRAFRLQLAMHAFGISCVATTLPAWRSVDIHTPTAPLATEAPEYQMIVHINETQPDSMRGKIYIVT